MSQAVFKVDEQNERTHHVINSLRQPEDTNADVIYAEPTFKKLAAEEKWSELLEKTTLAIQCRTMNTQALGLELCEEKETGTMSGVKNGPSGEHTQDAVVSFNIALGCDYYYQALALLKSERQSDALTSINNYYAIFDRIKAYLGPKDNLTFAKQQIYIALFWRDCMPASEMQEVSYLFAIEHFEVLLHSKEQMDEDYLISLFTGTLLSLFELYFDAKDTTKIANLLDQLGKFAEENWIDKSVLIFYF